MCHVHGSHFRHIVKQSANNQTQSPDPASSTACRHCQLAFTVNFFSSRQWGTAELALVKTSTVGGATALLYHHSIKGSPEPTSTITMYNNRKETTVCSLFYMHLIQLLCMLAAGWLLFYGHVADKHTPIKESLFYLTTPLEPIDFNIIGY